MKNIKRSIAVIFVAIMVLSVVAVGVQAATVSTTTIDYGYMMPTDNKFTKTVSTVKLYGSYDYINFYFDAEYNCTYFFYEIYSDENYTKLVTSDYVYCEDSGTYTWSPFLKLKGVFKSGTYYCITYGAKVDSSGNIKLSTPSVSEFKIVVDRTTAFNKQVVLLKNVKTTVNGPQITWYKHSSAATKYVVYRRSEGGTKWTKVGTVDAPTLTFTDKSVKDKSGQYVYTVKALNKNGAASRYQFSGLTSDFVATPVIKSVTTQMDNKIKIEWNKASCNYYRIYRKTNGGSWEVIMSQYYGTNYTDTKVESGNNYEYTVKGMRNRSVGSGFYTGYKVDYVAAPTLSPVKAVEGGLEVSWSETQGATAYTVYRRPLDKSSGWANLGKVEADTLTFVDETAESDGAYLYTVRSEGATSRGSYNSKGIEYVVLQHPEFNIEIVDTNNLKAVASKVPNATSYKLYFKNTDGEWEYLRSSSSGSFTVEKTGAFSKFKDYEFAVSAVCGGTETDYIKNSETLLYNPGTTTSCKVYKDYNQISWTNSSGGIYNLYKKNKDADDSEYKLIYSGSERNYKDTDVEYNVGYTYVAKAVFNDVEQNDKLTCATKIRYKAEDYIETFRPYGEFYTSKTTYKYPCELKDTAEGMGKMVYYSKNGIDAWVLTSALAQIKASDTGVYFSLVAYDENGSTPVDGYVVLVTNEKCDPVVLKNKAVKDGLNLSWNDVGAIEYKITGYENPEKIITADGSSSYSVTFAPSELSEPRFGGYDFTVEAVHSNGNRTFSYLKEVVYIEEIPEFVTVIPNDKGVKLEIKENGMYCIFRKAPGDKTWTKLACVTSNEYIDKTATEGVKYTYTLRHYSSSKKTYNSYYNTKGFSVGYIMTPEITTVGNSTRGVYLDCEELASDYYIKYYWFRRTENGKWEKIGCNIDSEGFSLTGKNDLTAKTGMTYYYTVIAAYGSYKSGYDKTGLSIRFIEAPTLISAKHSSNGVTLKWSEVEGVDGYYVYRRLPYHGWTKIGTVKNGSTITFNDTTAIPGTSYYYTVKAYSGSDISSYQKQGIKSK